MTVNERDLWTEFGAFLAETAPDGHSNMDALTRVPKTKDITTVDFRERNGVELPSDPDMKFASVDRTLQFWLAAGSEDERLQKFRGLMTLLTAGKLTVAVKGYRTYRLIYQDMPMSPEWHKSQDGQKYGVLFSVKFLDYSPSV